MNELDVRLFCEEGRAHTLLQEYSTCVLNLPFIGKVTPS